MRRIVIDTDCLRSAPVYRPSGSPVGCTAGGGAVAAQTVASTLRLCIGESLTAQVGTESGECGSRQNHGMPEQ
jgi:hypothetical protein